LRAFQGGPHVVVGHELTVWCPVDLHGCDLIEAGRDDGVRFHQGGQR
jgi:hypothetical protein